MEDDSTPDRGKLLVITKHVTVFWTEEEGWNACVEESEAHAEFARGYGDYAGMSQVECIIPAPK